MILKMTNEDEHWVLKLLSNPVKGTGTSKPSKYNIETYL